MFKNLQKTACAVIFSAVLTGCNSSTFHEDAAKRLENGMPADLPGAIGEYKQAIESDKSHNTNLRVELANCCLKNNDAMGAIEAARQATDLEPRNAQAHMLLGQAYEKRTPPALNDARAEYDNAFTCDSKMVEASIASGKIYEQLGDNKSAESRYRDAVKANANSAAAHEALALVLSKLGDMANAEAENKEATRLKAAPAKPQS